VKRKKGEGRRRPLTRGGEKEDKKKEKKRKPLSDHLRPMEGEKKKKKRGKDEDRVFFVPTRGRKKKSDGSLSVTIA